MATAGDRSILFTLLGLNRRGRILYTALVMLAGPLLVGWFVLLPRWRFSDEDEHLFRAARHGDVAAVERALAAGGRVDAASPVDGKTALFRAAVFGHVDVVHALRARGADPAARGSDGRTALEVVRAARATEKDPAVGRALDIVMTALQEPEPGR